RILVPSCAPCNQSKGGRDWKAWVLGKAKGSPTTRKIPDITQKNERLEGYVACLGKALTRAVGGAGWRGAVGGVLAASCARSRKRGRQLRRRPSSCRRRS